MEGIIGNKIEENSHEEEYKKYVEDLQLSVEDLQKKILDVGSGESYFAKWAKKKNINSNIISLEPKTRTEETAKSVKGRAEAIPLKDESFDLVLSNCSIPNIFLGENLENVKKDVKASLLEMMRVVKPGGEIRLGNVLRGDKYENQRNLSIALSQTLEELKKTFGTKIEQIHFVNEDTYEWKGNEQTDQLLAETYLIKIHKPQ